MKILLLSIIFLLSSYAHAQDESAMQFAERLKDIIVNGKVDVFNKLPCFPSDCIDQDDINYVFGADNKKGFVKSFLTKPEIKIKVFGPYQYSDYSSNSNYALMFYDPNIVKFNSDGYLSMSDRESLWWVGYVETVVIFKDGKWGFNRTPFYYGAHLPWAEDY